MFTKQSIFDYHNMNRIIFRDQDFMYLLPHSSLRKWISNYSITFPHTEMMSEQYTIIPHGSTTMVFTVDSNQIDSKLFGPLVKPACVGNQINSFYLIFIIEFHPAGYFAFSNLPQKELTDIVLPLCDLDPMLHRLIEQRLEKSTNIDTFINEIDRLFMNYVKTSFYQQEFSLANQKIIQSGGALSVKELSQETYYSERHLNRMFDKYLGISAKSFSRLVRINKALQFLQRPSLSIQQVCMKSGFYDMPHFMNDFKSICGITPQAYRNHMSDFYNEIAKF